MFLFIEFCKEKRWKNDFKICCLQVALWFKWFIRCEQHMWELRWNRLMCGCHFLLLFHFSIFVNIYMHWYTCFSFHDHAGFLCGKKVFFAFFLSYFPWKIPTKKCWSNINRVFFLLHESFFFSSTFI